MIAEAWKSQINISQSREQQNLIISSLGNFSKLIFVPQHKTIETDLTKTLVATPTLHNYLT